MKNKETARRLQEALDRKGMTPAELAKKSGVSKSSISQYVNGSHAPSNISSAKMAEVLGVNALWLMGFDLPEPTMDFEIRNDDCDLLIEVQKNLNEEGLKKLREYAQDLMASKRYEK